MKKRSKLGIATPAWDQEPEAPSEWQWVLEGFGQLCRTRQSNGFGPCSLALTDIQSYLDLIGVQVRSDRLAFFELVTILDSVFLEWSQSNGQHPPGNSDTQG